MAVRMICVRAPKPVRALVRLFAGEKAQLEQKKPQVRSR